VTKMSSKNFNNFPKKISKSMYKRINGLSIRRNRNSFKSFLAKYRAFPTVIRMKSTLAYTKSLQTITSHRVFSLSQLTRLRGTFSTSPWSDYKMLLFVLKELSNYSYTTFTSSTNHCPKPKQTYKLQSLLKHETNTVPLVSLSTQAQARVASHENISSLACKSNSALVSNAWSLSLSQLDNYYNYSIINDGNLPVIFFQDVNTFNEIISREHSDLLVFITSNITPNQTQHLKQVSSSDITIKNFLVSRISMMFKRKFPSKLRLKKRRRLLNSKKFMMSTKKHTHLSMYKFKRGLSMMYRFKDKKITSTNGGSTNNKFTRYFYDTYSKIHNLNHNNTITDNTVLTTSTSTLDTSIVPAYDTLTSTLSVYHTKSLQTLKLNGNYSNIYPVQGCFNFKFNKFRPILTRQLNFYSDITPWVNDALIRFIEFTSGSRALIQHNMNIEGMVDKHSKLTYRRWILRMGYYERMLGHRFFMEEALHIIHLSLKNHDVNLFSSWLKAIITRISFWKTRSIFRFLKYIFNNYYRFMFNDLSSKGIKIRLKGKISAAGNSRKRTILFRSVKNSYSSVNVKCLHDFKTITTFTGVMGFQVWLFY
jgi:hypothetical protein